MPSAPLTSREVATLAELLELLLPSQSGPGAREAGSLDYVLGRLTAAEAEQVGPLRSLLADAAGREEDHLRLLCTADDQWFSRLRHWAWEGYLCDPAHGGGRDDVGRARLAAPLQRRPPAW